MKRRRDRLLVAAIGGVGLLWGAWWGAWWGAVKHANTHAGWVSDKFWTSFKVGLALMVLGLIVLLFNEDE